MRRQDLAILIGLIGASLPGCDESTVDSPFQASDAGTTDAGTPPSTGVDPDPPDAGPSLGQPCLDDGQCDDGLACTFDQCVPSAQRCRSMPDHSLCADDVFCNGVEQCDPLLGCRAGEPVSCSDGTPCTLDRCVEEEQGCHHDPRDADGDGDVDRLCEGEGDCNDTDPKISSLHDEICFNGRDDDCDSVIDEDACVRPEHDVCADPYLIQGPSSFQLSSRAMDLDYAADCVSTEMAAHDLVLAVEVEDGPQDVEIVASSEDAELWLAGFGECSDQDSEISCVTSGIAINEDVVARLRLRGLEPGLHSVVVFADVPATISFSVTYLDPDPKPLHEECGDAIGLEPGSPTLVPLADSRRDEPSVCGMVYGDLVYNFTLDQPSDVTLRARSLDGYGEPQLSLQRDTCVQQASEITCRRGDGAVLFARGLEAGTYFVAVGATGPSDVQLTLELSEPSQAPSDDQCLSPPQLELQQLTTIDLADHADDVFEGCLPGGIDAVYSLAVTEPSDVLLIERFAEDQWGAVNLFDFPCTGDDRLSCAVSNLTPVRAAMHNLQPGEYAVVAEASLPTEITLTALRRPAQPPSVVAFADTCESALVVPAEGGFFQGNTANATAQYDTGCDLPAQGQGGAPEQMLKLVLESEKRVVLDMMGSSYATMLAVRDASSCPGTQLPNACSVGATSARSYLDLTLPSGEYFVQVDGFAREEGPWFLDVYIVDP